MNESCHTYEWVISHVWMGHVTHMNESCNTYEWVMSHIWMSHVTHMNESHHTYEWGLSYVWIFVIHESESCHTCHAHVWVGHRLMQWISFVEDMNETGNTQECPAGTYECMCVYMNVCVCIWMRQVTRKNVPQARMNVCVCIWMYVCIWMRQVTRKNVPRLTLDED